MTDVRTDFPNEVHVIEHVTISMADGTRLSARLWLPEIAAPVPAILEYLPYRKDDITLWRDQAQLGWLAGHGYACLRVDLRGTGDSEGVIRGEYLAQELHDGAEVIAWMADQPWCDGNVGMWGISWGGFNALQVAALRPPALGAVISVASTVDRYADDVHYRGGSVLGSDMLAWATEMLARNALPPTPRHSGDGWGERWLQRLDATLPFVHDWLAHQARDGFWQHGSVCDDFDAIDVPALVVAGFADGYSNTPFLALEGLGGLARGIVGPWSHNYPELGDPGPNIGFLQLARRWWDRWLRGDGTVTDLPRLAVYLQDPAPPSPDHDGERPGRWIADPVAADEEWWLGSSGLERTHEEGVIHISTPQQHGLHGGAWWSVGESGTGPADQRSDDDLAHVLDGPPAPSQVSLCGFPTLRLRVSADRPVAMVAARLCDLAPDGSSLLVSRGQLNLTHRVSSEHPTPLEPGAWYDVSVSLDAAAHRLPVGHRWRLAVASTNWPLAWPSPEVVTLSMDLAHSRLLLPVVDATVDLEPAFPELAEIAPTDRHEERPDHSRVVIDVGEQIVRRHEAGGGRHVVDAHGTVVESRSLDELGIRPEDPVSAVAHSVREFALTWPEHRILVEADATMTCDEDSFRVRSRLRAWDGDRDLFDRSWDESFPRVLL